MSDFVIDSTSLEENVLTALVHLDSCTAMLVLHIEPGMFPHVHYQQIARRALEYIQKYRAAPRAHIRDLFEAELRNTATATGKQYFDIFNAMETLAPNIQHDYVLDKLQDFIDKAGLRKVIEDAHTLLTNNDVLGAKLALTAPQTMPSFSVGTYFHRPDESLRFLNVIEEAERFTSGIGELDRRGIRPSRKTIMLLIAPPKAGKSWYLLNQGKANVVRGKRVLHITCENSEELTAKRYVQSFYSMATREIGKLRLPYFQRHEGHEGVTISFQNLKHKDDQTGNLDRDVEVLDESRRGFLSRRLQDLGRLRANPLLIKEFPSGVLTVPMIIAYLDMLERSEGFIPDLLIVDYPKQMHIKMSEYRLSLGQILIDLRGVAVSRNMAVTTVMQGSKKAKDSGTVTGTMISEDYSAIGTVDTVLTYSQTADEKQSGLARILVDAARDGADSFLVMVTQSYDIGQFCIDSAYFGENLQSEAEKLFGPYTKKGKRGDDDE